MRLPDEVMRLNRLGSFHATRLSFLRVLLRRIGVERWTFERPRFEIGADGVGVAVYTLTRGARTYSLVAFAHDLPAGMRTDRVIAEAWDATFALVDGVPDDADIARLAADVPRQEAGRYSERELVLARANRSVRLFDRVVAALAEGRQPDAVEIEATGYLMRTTAVYGNGKFGIADRDLIAGREELAGPFQAEMLAVWLIRTFTVDLVDHLAACRAPGRAVRLNPDLRRRLGIGNATGLGMAPFLVRHPALIHNWIGAREMALARVLAVKSCSAAAKAHFGRCLAGARHMVAGWRTDDQVQAPRIDRLRADLVHLAIRVEAGALEAPQPWADLMDWAKGTLSTEGQELLVSLMIEPHGALVDDLAAGMSCDETASFAIDGCQSCSDLMAVIERNYGWALAIDFADPQSNQRFWYVSEEKLEPRLGDRRTESGAELEQPLAIARDVQALRALLERPRWRAPDLPVADLLQVHPETRHVVRRIQIHARRMYAEVRENLIAADLRAVDLLRCKLAFFGCQRFDPRSDKWLRITLYQGAPYPDEIGHADFDGWMWVAPAGAP